MIKFAKMSKILKVFIILLLGMMVIFHSALPVWASTNLQKDEKILSRERIYYSTTRTYDADINPPKRIYVTTTRGYSSYAGYISQKSVEYDSARKVVRVTYGGYIHLTNDTPSR